MDLFINGVVMQRVGGGVHCHFDCSRVNGKAGVGGLRGSGLERSNSAVDVVHQQLVILLPQWLIVRICVSNTTTKFETESFVMNEAFNHKRNYTNERNSRRERGGGGSLLGRTW